MLWFYFTYTGQGSTPYIHDQIHNLKTVPIFISSYNKQCNLYNLFFQNSVLHLNGKISSWEAVDSAIGSFVADAIVNPTKSFSGCSVEVQLAISPQVLALNSSPKSLPL
ncbi:hypothetical protein QYF36_011345 [Acer negundo]|nr:hypothetical protein QYF36_011345 [Acer negundo]